VCLYIFLAKWEVRSSTENKRNKNKNEQLGRMEKLMWIVGGKFIKSYFLKIYPNHVNVFSGRNSIKHQWGIVTALYKRNENENALKRFFKMVHLSNW
jgi:hypothetical protein